MSKFIVYIQIHDEELQFPIMAADLDAALLWAHGNFGDTVTRVRQFRQHVEG